ncbi:hypothetical protein IC007_0983 [Sulfuracidifex tepidarius]|uniref:Uncharacterized protein n=1 Tax=Sulfuracidifex tepidarius TaxID=1294262 RepID=A0A510E1V4_9CREN|nr:hypothetical protein IC007_0983 [Sulfuracidifex tepidarius]
MTPKEKWAKANLLHLSSLFTYIPTYVKMSRGIWKGSLDGE